MEQLRRSFNGIINSISVIGLLLCVTMLSLLTSCTNRTERSGFAVLDSTATSINFVNKLEPTEKLNILDYLYFYNGAGVAAGDINNDGLTDLYFVSNQGQNKLYLNKGALKFEDITEKAGVGGFADWQTGVTMADVNGDGLLDIYVCAVGDFRGLEGANELYINNGDLTFSENAADYGLDFTGFSTQATFFDYDRDGDLDMYLLNHAVHTSRSYDRVSTRAFRHHESGDYLFQNQLHNGSANCPKKFIDVSEQAGIYQAAMGYGLGVVVTDFNQDGWDDLYVSNDFHEDDYYYVNLHNGTFKEEVKDHFAHLSRFSMGCDAADINNDAYPDLMTLDMYPQDEVVEKSSAGEDPFDIFTYKLQFGYFNQYSRNCLQLNAGKGHFFSDIALHGGVAATDWSWSTLMADYDNDGLKDIFITNGIVKRPNDLDYVKFISNDSVTYGAETPEMRMKSFQKMPEGKVHNYFYKGVDGMSFEDKSIEWGFENPSVSNGAIYADLDNDGDLDLVANNINEQVSVYENQTADGERKSLKVKFTGLPGNNFGLGAKVLLKNAGKLQYQQVVSTRGFESAVEPALFFGVGSAKQIDTLVVWWPNDKVEIKTRVKLNEIILNQNDATLGSDIFYNLLSTPGQQLVAEQVAPIDFFHHENDFHDFYREPLVPFEVSTEGPALAIGDVNDDGMEDVYVGGAKFQAGAIFIQRLDGSFIKVSNPVFEVDSIFEDVDAIFIDVDNDHDLDLYVVSGGNEFYENMTQQFDRLYLNNGLGGFTRSNSLPEMFSNKSCVKPNDFDNDGDVDLFVGGRVMPNQYGLPVNSYLLRNDGKGNFEDVSAQLAPELRKLGMVTDAVWMDVNSDKQTDLVIVGEWMPITVFRNNNGKFIKIPVINAGNGFWQCIEKSDIDNDGDDDLIIGNLGTNSKLCKPSHQLKLIIKDIDNNESLEHILAYNTNGSWYPVASKDELAKQLPLLRKKFTDYKTYAGKTIDKIFDPKELEGALELHVDNFESIMLENDGKGNFVTHPLPATAQISKLFTCLVSDIDHDGKSDFILGGNDYAVSMYQGRYDTSYGHVLKGNGTFTPEVVPLLQSGLRLKGEVRNIRTISRKKDNLILVARNNMPLQAFQIRDNEQITKR